MGILSRSSLRAGGRRWTVGPANTCHAAEPAQHDKAVAANNWRGNRLPQSAAHAALARCGRCCWHGACAVEPYSVYRARSNLGCIWNAARETERGKRGRTGGGNCLHAPWLAPAAGPATYSPAHLSVLFDKRAAAADTAAGAGGL